MSWRETLRTASFRGAEFQIESVGSSHGRRQAVHEHAQRDTPYTEDLGRKAREFTITAYIVGPQYYIGRDALIEACEQAGPGQLVHPYKGDLTVVCRGLTVSESAKEGGMCRLSLTFLEAGEASFPSSRIDSVNAISSASNQVAAAAQMGFIERFITAGFPSFVRDAAAAQIQQFAAFLGEPGSSLLGEANAAAEFFLSLNDLANDAASLVLSPAQLAERIVGTVSGVRAAFGASSFAVLAALYQRFSAPYAGKTQTPSRRQQGRNFDANSEIVRQVVISEAAKVAAVTVYPSYQEAIGTRTTLLDALDDETERTTNDDAFTALIALRAQVVQAIPGPDKDLPRLLSYTPKTTLPSLIIAHQLYGDASRAEEIASRNSPRHPGFMTGGKALEVLSDG